MGGSGDKMSVTIPCPGIPPSANVLRRKYRDPHAYAKLRDGFKHTLYYLVTGRDRAWLMAMAAIGKKMRVDITLIHKKQYDPDNLAGSVKPLLDSLVNLRFLANDDPPHIDLHIMQQKLNANETILVIREADGEN
jgi:hypothetical protein